MVLECSGYDDHVQSNVVTQHHWDSKIFTLVGWGRTSHSWIRYYSFINQLVLGPHVSPSERFLWPKPFKTHTRRKKEPPIWNHSGFVRNSGNYPKKIHGIPHFQSHPHLRLAASLSKIRTASKANFWPRLAHRWSWNGSDPAQQDRCHAGDDHWVCFRENQRKPMAYGLWLCSIQNNLRWSRVTSLFLSSSEDPAWLHWVITPKNAIATAKWPSTSGGISAQIWVHPMPWLEAPARPSRVRRLGIALTRSASTLSPARRHLQRWKIGCKNGHETRCLLWHVTLEIPIHLGKSMKIIAFWMHLIHLHILRTDCAKSISRVCPIRRWGRHPPRKLASKESNQHLGDQPWSPMGMIKIHGWWWLMIDVVKPNGCFVLMAMKNHNHQYETKVNDQSMVDGWWSSFVILRIWR